jgi:DNA-binding beta-propeller fold protein YncE
MALRKIACAVGLALLPTQIPDAASPDARLFFLDIRGGRVLSANPDGSDPKVLIDGHRNLPDGIALDIEAGHIYWSNMGRAADDDGSVMRADLDGGNVTTIVPRGGTFTAKQLKLDKKNGKLYWSDREGMRIQRANLDGSRVETLIETGHGADERWDARNWCVGIAVDVAGGRIYWTQKGGDDAGAGRILRANIEIPRGQDPAHRTDVEVLFDGLPEPIDLDLDLRKRMIYWTDRGDLPGGNSVARAPMDPPARFNPWTRTDRTVLVEGLREGIGIALDLAGNRMYITDLGGSVYSARLDGTDKKTLLTEQGALTGIAVGVAAADGTARKSSRR